MHLSILIFVTLPGARVPCLPLFFIKLYGGAPWPEPSDLYGIVLGLVWFHTFVNLLEAVDHIMAGLRFRSLLALLYAVGKVYDSAERCHLLENNGFHTITAAKIFGMPLRVEPVEDQDAESKTVGIDQVADAMREGVNTGASPVNECGNANEDQSDDTEVHSDYVVNCKPFMMIWRSEEKQICPPGNAVYGQDWHSETIIKSERTGNCAMHIMAMREILPQLAGSGHNLYLESIQIFRLMIDYLSNTQKCYSISNRFPYIATSCPILSASMDWPVSWAVTTDKERHGWVATSHLSSVKSGYAEVNEVPKPITSVHFRTSIQHKTCSAARQ